MHFTLNLESEVTHAYHCTPLLHLAYQLISESSSTTFVAWMPEFFSSSLISKLPIGAQLVLKIGFLLSLAPTVLKFQLHNSNSVVALSDQSKSHLKTMMKAGHDLVICRRVHCSQIIISQPKQGLFVGTMFQTSTQ